MSLTCLHSNKFLNVLFMTLFLHYDMSPTHLILYSSTMRCPPLPSFLYSSTMTCLPLTSFFIPPLWHVPHYPHFFIPPLWHVFHSPHFFIPPLWHVPITFNFKIDPTISLYLSFPFPPLHGLCVSYVAPMWMPHRCHLLKDSLKFINSALVSSKTSPSFWIVIMLV